LNAMKNINSDNLSILMNYGVSDEIVSNMNYIVNNVKKVADNNYNIFFDFTLVRGMGYYTGPIFEISYKSLGLSIAGGGRYDEMIGGFLGENIPSVGFSIGFERLVNQMIDEKFNASGRKKIVLLYDESDSISDVIIYADKLRKDGFSVSIITKTKKLSKQLAQFEKQEFSKFAIYSTNSTEIKDLN